MDLPTFATKEELFDHLIENKDILIAEKKSAVKHADAFTYTKSKEHTVKAESGEGDDPSTILVKSVINTTNVLDSHGDVHIPKLWNKSLRENKNPYLLQEHQMRFDKIISDEVKASAVMVNWSDLGFKFKGQTQALTFESKIHKDRNEFMFNQYRKGYVKNHSVGMQYVRLSLAINDEDYKEEFATWNKYIDSVVNKDVAEGQGYFWAVIEAKMIEGSAVPMGSNQYTPTQTVEDKSEAAHKSTPNNGEPPSGTQRRKLIF